MVGAHVWKRSKAAVAADVWKKLGWHASGLLAARQEAKCVDKTKQVPHRRGHKTKIISMHPGFWVCS